MVTLADFVSRMTARDDQEETSALTADRGIVLAQLGAAVHFSDTAEVMAAFRHRYLLAHYFAFSVKVLVLSYLLSLSDTVVGVLYPAILIGFAAAFWTVAAYLWVAFRLRRPAEAREPVRMRLEPGIVLGGLAMGLAMAFVVSRIGAGHSGRMEPDLLGILLPVLYLLLAVAYLLRRPIPRALNRLRGDCASAPVAVARPVAGLPIAEAGEDAPPEGDPAGDDARSDGDPAGDAAEQAVEIGDDLKGSVEQAALAAVLRLEADGNYVTVVTERGRMSVPGPFAAVVARMPVGAGRQVHRSHWVARRAVTGDRRVGRDVRLQTVDGESVPVSAAQVAAVRAWLSQGGEGRDHGKSREARTW